MNYEYTLALMLPEGSDAPFQAYLNTMEKQFGFAYPLPFLIPLGGFAKSFPPDRVDREFLRALPGLSFGGITEGPEGIILGLSVPSLKDRALGCLRGIHGQEKPSPLSRPLFSWEGLLLHPAGFPRPTGKGKEDFLPPPGLTWQTYRLVLIKVVWPENGPWWKHVQWEILWKIRKPRANKNT